MTVPSERFLWAFVEARFGIVPNALNGASHEDEPLRPDAGSGPGYAKTPTARGVRAVGERLAHVPKTGPEPP